MADAILTLNAGSSSIKFALFARGAEIPQQPELVGQIDGIGAAGQAAHIKVKDAAGQVLDDSDLDLAVPGKTPHQAALRLLVDWLHGHEAGWTIAGVGHRVVHGAQQFSRPVRSSPERLPSWSSDRHRSTPSRRRLMTQE